jgi:hypothetical protein
MAFFEQLSLSNLTALGVCFALLMLVNSIQWKKPSKLEVPLADGGIPLLGHTISFLQDACSLCFKMKDKYGSIYSLKIGRTRFNILTDVASGMLVFLLVVWGHPLLTIVPGTGINFFYRNEKTFMAEYFHHRFNKYVALWSDKFNSELEFRELLRSNSCKFKVDCLIV